MEAYERRMMKEREDLYKKVYKLRKFMKGDLFRCLTPQEQNFMNDQLFHMQGYLIALENRLHSRDLL